MDYLNNIIMNFVVPFFPEIFLSLIAMILLMASAFIKRNRFIAFGAATIIALVFAIIFEIFFFIGFDHQLLVNDHLARFGKVITLAVSLVCCVFACNYFSNGEKQPCKPEYFVLILLACVGMMFMVSSTHFLTVYLAVELFGLCAYILAAFETKSLKSTEAGLKYFILGVISSCVLLFGISLVYGTNASLQFTSIYMVGSNELLISSLALVFIIAALAFKLSAAPFHMWTPDVYEGSPTPVTAFFSTAPKVAGLILLSRILISAFPGMLVEWQMIITFLAILSMFVGAISAIFQKNIKRLLAYSSISHVGYALIGLATGNQDGIKAMLVYIVIYLFMSLGMFAAVLRINKHNQLTEEIVDFSGLKNVNITYAICVSIYLFSFFGLPITIGFWGKFSVFMPALANGMIILPICGIIASVISAFYYLYIIKRIWFDEPRENVSISNSAKLRLVMFLAALLVGFGLFIPNLVLNLEFNALAAAASLF